MPSILAERLADRVDAVIGVDTHTDTHTAVVVTPVGTVLAELGRGGHRRRRRHVAGLGW